MLRPAVRHPATLGSWRSVGPWHCAQYVSNVVRPADACSAVNANADPAAHASAEIAKARTA
jgi:hypothetical protein